jgi:hypothetical protein
MFKISNTATPQGWGCGPNTSVPAEGVRPRTDDVTGQKSRTSPGSGRAAEPAESRVLSLALVAVCLGYFMVILNTTIVNERRVAS